MLQKLIGATKTGFTLIELMIIIAIIGILSAIAIPNFLSYRAKDKDTATKSEAGDSKGRDMKMGRSITH